MSNAKNRARGRPQPSHKARLITSLMTGKAVGWSIYPEQLPAMREQAAKAIYAEDYGWTVPWSKIKGDARTSCLQIADAALKAIGLTAPCPPQGRRSRALPKVHGLPVSDEPSINTPTFIPDCSPGGAYGAE